PSENASSAPVRMITRTSASSRSSTKALDNSAITAASSADAPPGVTSAMASCRSIAICFIIFVSSVRLGDFLFRLFILRFQAVLLSLLRAVGLEPLIEFFNLSNTLVEILLQRLGACAALNQLLLPSQRVQ